MYVCMYVCTCVCMYVCMDVCMYACMCRYVYVYVDVYTYIYIYMYCTHTCTCMCICVYIYTTCSPERKKLESLASRCALQDGPRPAVDIFLHCMHGARAPTASYYMNNTNNAREP